MARSQPQLRAEVGKRVEDDEPGHAIRVRQREAERERAAERFAYQDGGLAGGRQLVQPRQQVAHQAFHAISVVAQPMRDDVESRRKERHLPIEQQSRPVHAGYQHHQRLVGCHLGKFRGTAEISARSGPLAAARRVF